jgi:tripartite ATP-independent transporter DctM subunit
MDSGILALLMFAITAGGVFMGFPVFAVLMGTAFLVGLVGWGPVVIDQMVYFAFGVLMNDALPAVPLFVFMGSMLDKSGIAERSFRLMQILFGSVKGSVALATLALCTLFAAGTGIVGASVSIMGLLALPVMIRRKYDPAIATGTILAGGTLGILIPPSIMLVLYGPLAGLSVARLFTAAILPGLLLSFLFFLYIFIRCLINPSLGPALPLEERKMPARQLAYLLVTDLIPFLFTIIAVLGSIIFGFASPTEAASVGCVGAMVLAALHGQVNLKNFRDAAYETLTTSAFILLITVSANIFCGVFLALGGGDIITSILTGLPLGSYGVLFIILLIIFLMGFFIEWIAILLIFIPIITPVIPTLGFDPLWFAVVVCVCLQTAFLTPPFATSIFYLKGVAPPEVKLQDIYKGVIPFVALQLTGLVICILFPQLILWLPNLIYG